MFNLNKNNMPKNQKIEQLQTWLFDHNFAPKGMSKEKFVDGYDGPITQKALGKAKSENWKFDKEKPYYSTKITSKVQKNPTKNVLLETVNKEVERAKKVGTQTFNRNRKEDNSYGNSMKDNQRRFVAELQKSLISKGYNVGKDGADGRMGNNTRRALAQAEKDGFQVINNRLIKGPQQTKKSQQDEKSQSTNIGLPETIGISGREGHAMNLATKWVGDRIGDTFNYIGRKMSGLAPFIGAPYEGSEEEARKLGYKHYTADGFTRKPVDYSIPNQENMTKQEKAQAQLDRYGITSEQTRDKSQFSKWVYEHAPGHGYNVFRLLENSLKGNKVRENGKRVLNPQPTPMADAVSDFTAAVYDFVNAPEKAQEIRLQKGYNIGESSNRNDLSNLYFGYPMQGKSLRISERTQTGKGNKPDQGYFYEFVNDGNIYHDPAYSEAIPGGSGIQASGENMGDWGASIDSEGRKAYYDLWDINPLTAIGLKGLPNVDLIGTGFELYGKQKR